MAPAPQPMLLQLLGAPRLLRGGQAVRVGSRKALALLALTALDDGVTRERLAALLWPEVEPASARQPEARTVPAARTWRGGASSCDLTGPAGPGTNFRLASGILRPAE